MTGEISLTGKVLPIGGLKEKIVAAKREGVRTVIIPKANQHDWEELNEILRLDMTAHFVEDYEQVYKIAFGFN
jgi:ATP-dependent Lon protease